MLRLTFAEAKKQRNSEEFVAEDIVLGDIAAIRFHSVREREPECARLRATDRLNLLVTPLQRRACPLGQ